jgi:hypothetical protein
MITSTHQIGSFIKKLAVGSLLGLFWFAPVLARSPVLEWADIYNSRNNVQWKAQNQNWISVTRGYRLQPQGVLRIGSQSRADLEFSEGTLAWAGSNTTFEFRRRLNELDLIRGRVLHISSPGSTRGKGLEEKDETIGTLLSIKTAEAEVKAIGTTFFVERNPESKTTLIGVLASSLESPVTVSGARKGTAKVHYGQIVSVVDGVVGAVEDFDLLWFYRTSELAAGLGPGQEKLVGEKPTSVQRTLKAVRAKTLAAVEEQRERLELLPQEGLSPLDLPGLCLSDCELSVNTHGYR